jgi:hypothetical protein
MAARVLEQVPDGGAVSRVDVARHLEVDRRDAGLRRAIAGLVGAGVLEEGRDSRGRVVLARPGVIQGAAGGVTGVPPSTRGADAPPAAHPVAARGVQTAIPGVEATA